MGPIPRPGAATFCSIQDVILGDRCLLVARFSPKHVAEKSRLETGWPLLKWAGRANQYLAAFGFLALFLSGVASAQTAPMHTTASAVTNQNAVDSVARAMSREATPVVREKTIAAPVPMQDASACSWQGPYDNTSYTKTSSQVGSAITRQQFDALPKSTVVSINCGSYIQHDVVTYTLDEIEIPPVPTVYHVAYSPLPSFMVTGEYIASSVGGIADQFIAHEQGEHSSYYYFTQGEYELFSPLEDVTTTSDTVYGNRTNSPTVWHIEGNLHINTNLVAQGYLTLLIKHLYSVTGTVTPGTDSSTYALIPTTTTTYSQICSAPRVMSGAVCALPPDTPDPKKDPDPDNCEGNPCNAGSGNKYQHESDYAGTGPYPLIAERVYNSRAVQSANWGSNWRGSYDRSIVFVTNGTISTAHVMRGDGKEYSFNGSGAAWVVDRDVNGKLTRLTDAGGNTTGWQYENEAEEVEGYDAAGRLVSITNRIGLTQTLAYSCKTVSSACPVVTPDAVAPIAGLLLTVTDPSGRQLNFTYDSAARVATMVDPASGTYRYTYSDATAAANLTSVTYPDGKVRSYVYGEPAYVSATPTAGVTYVHALTGLIDENGIRYATWNYDDKGRAISSEHAVGLEKVSLTYNADRTTTVVDSLGATRTRNFAIVNGVVKNTGTSQPAVAGSPAASSERTYDANGNAVSRTDLNGNQTTYVFDLIRNLETSRTEAVGTPQARTITTTWHPTYRLPTQINESGRITSLTYDAKGNLLQKSINANGDERNWAYTYNLFGQLLTATGPRTDVADVTTYTYDAQGNLVNVRNALGHTTQILSYDPHGRPLTIADPNGLSITLTYDARQRLTARDAGGEITGYEYDGTGQLQKVTQPDGAFIHYSYDDGHRMTAISDNLGNRIDYTLDAMGNRIQEQVKDPGGILARQTTRVFDALNRLQQVTGGMQ